MNTFRSRRSDFVALGLYILLTFLLTWPMPFQMSTHLAGSSNDTYINPWANWWTEKVIREGCDLYFTRYMFYPYGVSLTLHSFSHFNTLLWFLLRPLVGNLVAYNATVLLAYPLSGLAMFALVRYLTNSTLGAFIASLIFAFSPYHIVESAHPVLVTTQWLPFFLLFLIKTVRSSDRRICHASLALLFLWLTGLSSWHLLAFAFILASTYLVYSLIAERPLWDWRLVMLMAGIGIVCMLLLAPLAYPIVREQLSTESSALPIPIQLAESNDLLSFVLPSPYHPIFGKFIPPIHEQSRVADRRPAYLGFTAIGLALVALKTRRRYAVYWGMAGLLFLVLSLGPYVEVGGHRLHNFVLPWSIPIAGFFRNPFRFNTLIQFCLAVLAGWGAGSLLERLNHHAPWKPTLIAAGLAVLILLEYLSVPFPRTEPHVSAFYQQLAAEEAGVVVVEFPTGRRRDKEYLYYQTIHGKPTVNGLVSRPPLAAERFFDEVPILSALRDNRPFDWQERHVFAQLAPLAEKNIRYIIIHRNWFGPEDVEKWRDYFALPPVFEDEQLLVFSTRFGAAPIARLGADLALAWIGLPASPLRQGDTVSIEAVWATEKIPSSDWDLDVQLQDEQGTTAQHVVLPLRPDHSTSTWPEEAAIRGQYVIQVDPHLPPGSYHLIFALATRSDTAAIGENVTVGTIKVRPLERSFAIPPLEHRTSAVFSDTLALLGYGLQRDGDALHVTLHWQALRRMDYYKVFIHLYDVASGALVVQQDTVPRQWTYPTTWWEEGEIVSDEIALPLEGISAGRYRIAVGVYEPDTLKRLPVQTEGDVPLGDHLELEETVLIPSPY